jgi:hypothetical protein
LEEAFEFSRKWKLKPLAQTGSGELALDEAVVSATLLADRLEGVGRLMVRRGSVVTPAARDLLRERNIDLSYQAAAPKAGARTRLVVGLANTNCSITTLFNLLTREPLAIERVTATDLAAVVDELAAQLAKPMTLALLFTGDLAAALCLANRMPGVRAATAASIRDVVAAIAAIGVNLLVLDPTGKSPFILKQWIARFCQGAPRVCPEAWRQRLT